MSSTWIRAEIAARTAVRRVVSAGGTPRVSLRLAAIGACFQAAALAWSTFGSTARAVLLRGSWAYGLVALLVACDAALSLARFGPPTWALATRRRGRELLLFAPGATLSAAYALFAAALIASWSSHGAARVRLAAGEVYGALDQVVGFEGPRGGRPNPPRVELSVEQVEVEETREGGRSPHRAALLVRGGERVVARPWWPARLGWTEFAFAVDAGIAPRFELRDPRGGLLESAFAKLDVLPAGKRDVLTFERVPHRAVLEMKRDRTGSMRWVVGAYRGKLPVGSGIIAPGEPFAFDGLQLTLREGVPTVTLRIVRDLGIPFALAALFLAGVALALIAGAQVTARAAAPTVGGADDRC